MYSLSAYYVSVSVLGIGDTAVNKTDINILWYRDFILVFKKYPSDCWVEKEVGQRRLWPTGNLSQEANGEMLNAGGQLKDSLPWDDFMNKIIWIAIPCPLKLNQGKIEKYKGKKIVIYNRVCTLIIKSRYIVCKYQFHMD